MEVVLIPDRLAETPRQDGIDEPELVRCLQNQDAAAFMALYERFNRQVFWFLVHMTGSLHESEELLQAVFAAVWEAIATGRFKRFDAGRGTLEGYLLGIARHLARKLIAKRSRTVSVDEFESQPEGWKLSESGIGIAAMERHLEIRRLRMAIAQLPIKF